ncbi:hypothetical protein LshimejAT787_1901620 [Lyophyllum shimeji]|uniref:Uncharacterized protein n=1 Tax=Lyophyllum shimeji TaxID=47721 RepID=A0A9P3URH2_LYOSH|nr:hypothetical protein LshimejAT787_1901620 [Lyophyllum shimeji]
MSEAVVQRIIPGAPPPHRYSPVAIPDATSAALVEQAPDAADIGEGSVAPDLVAQTEPEVPPLPAEEVLLKPSPIVELVHKRLKATTKKIGRISTYASTDPEKLNDDQRRALKTLPSLEAVQKELGEVKKAIEVHESELVQELSIKRIEADKAEKARIASAVSAAEATITTKFSEVLDVLRLRSLLTGGQFEPFRESGAVFVAGDILLGDDADSKQAVLSGLLSGQGELEGVTYTHLIEATRAHLQPRIPTPVPEEVAAPETHAAPVTDSVADVTVGGVPLVPTTGSFHFMQASELESSSFEDGAEWVERSEAAEQHVVEVEQTQSVPQPLNLEQETPNGHITAPLPDVPQSAPVDWAADDDAGLPSLASLHTKFGTSGSATPVVNATPEEPEAAIEAKVNGHAEAPATPAATEDDGFTQARGGRGGRGRGQRDGERGGFRGFRGGDRGGFRGGDRGGFRSGDRGGRGGFRGGERGGFRGGRGEWRGGDGEFRGRGRGRGRGGDRGGAPPTST